MCLFLLLSLSLIVQVVLLVLYHLLLMLTSVSVDLFDELFPRGLLLYSLDDPMECFVLILHLLNFLLQIN